MHDAEEAAQDAFYNLYRYHHQIRDKEKWRAWLGQYVSLQVGAAQYIAVCIALGIAILTTAEIIWQNVSERGPEISLLKAVGWRNQSVRVSVLLEGMFTGVIAGMLGILLGLSVNRVYVPTSSVRRLVVYRPNRSYPDDGWNPGRLVACTDCSTRRPRTGNTRVAG